MSRDEETYLTIAEIERLTGRIYAPAQRRVLALNGWTFVPDGDGLPLVLRAVHDQRFGLDRKAAKRRGPRLVNTAPA